MTDPHNRNDSSMPNDAQAHRLLEALETLARTFAALEPGLERLLVSDIAEPALIDRARHAARRLRLHAERMALVLDGQNSRPWHGEERRSPQRATNVARLPDREATPAKPVTPASDDWEPF